MAMSTVGRPAAGRDDRHVVERCAGRSAVVGRQRSIAADRHPHGVLHVALELHEIAARAIGGEEVLGSATEGGKDDATPVIRGIERMAVPMEAASGFLDRHAKRAGNGIGIDELPQIAPAGIDRPDSARNLVWRRRLVAVSRRTRK